MSFTDLTTLIKENIDEAILVETFEDRGDPFVVVEAGRLIELLQFLRDDPRANLDHLSLITGVDYVKAKTMEVVYHFDSISKNTPFTVKVKLDRDECKVPSVVALYPTADWHEREVYDLSGVHFEGHPNLARILCADDWVGHPLRKDYEWPETYHGVPCGPFAKDEKNIPPEWELEGFTTKNTG